MSRPAALVTGSAVRLGRAIALALAEAGYDIALHYNRSAAPAEATAAEIRAIGVDCAIFQQDLRRADGLDAFVAQVQAAFPRLSVLVNSASAYDSGTMAETDVATFDLQFDVNLRAPFFLTRAFAARVDAGCVINIVDNKVGFNQYAYAAYLLSKKALVALTQMAAQEFAPRVRINAVAPGVVLPATTRSQAYVDWRIEGIPLKMQGEPRHITDAVLALIDNDFITGQMLVVDGGEASAHLGRNATEFDPALV